MPDASPSSGDHPLAGTKCAMFIPKLLRQRHLARGVEQGEPFALVERADRGRGWSRTVKKGLRGRSRAAARRAAHSRRRRSPRPGGRGGRRRARRYRRARGQAVEVDLARRSRWRAQSRLASSSRPSDTSIMALACGASMRPTASWGTGGDRPRPAGLRLSDRRAGQRGRRRRRPAVPTSHSVSPGCPPERDGI